ncbi:expressed unknown protein [Ectocarpus siliculosus]|uniref:Uncharacterized protein n=1 Tax=Ectocarpus siliculosus TaxID=2880 RepID=D7G2U0_ECTSI|nr:expressed unknown protein [Ectocarpus siliculosus]|eukprot:CBJ33444.1 expressed unknown protein [Ectocarpus siliculosus]
MLHGQPASPPELYGALVPSGVYPDRRPWAKKLLAQFSSLTEQRKNPMPPAKGRLPGRIGPRISVAP